VDHAKSSFRVDKGRRVRHSLPCRAFPAWQGRQFRKTFQCCSQILFFVKKSSSIFPKIMLISRHPAPSGGALRPIVTNVGSGMRWTQRLRETSAAGADGEIVWS